MKGFKRIGLLGLLCILSASATNSYVTDSIEDDIIQRYQEEVLNNARYNNYKDSRKKYLERELDNLKYRIDDCNNKINDCNYQISDLNDKIDYCKNRRTQLDEKLAKLMCLDDLGDYAAQSKMSILKRDISINENEIRNYESQKNSYISKKNELISNKKDLEIRLYNRKKELARM